MDKGHKYETLLYMFKLKKENDERRNATLNVIIKHATRRTAVLAQSQPRAELSHALGVVPVVLCPYSALSLLGPARTRLPAPTQKNL